MVVKDVAWIDKATEGYIKVTGMLLRNGKYRYTLAMDETAYDLLGQPDRVHIGWTANETLCVMPVPSMDAYTKRVGHKLRRHGTRYETSYVTSPGKPVFWWTEAKVDGGALWV